MMKKTKLNFDFMAHQERCQEEIYKAIHALPHQEQIQYYQELIIHSHLDKLINSIKDNRV